MLHNVSKKKNKKKEEEKIFILWFASNYRFVPWARRLLWGELIFAPAWGSVSTGNILSQSVEMTLMHVSSPGSPSHDWNAYSGVHERAKFVSISIQNWCSCSLFLIIIILHSSESWSHERHCPYGAVSRCSLERNTWWTQSLKMGIDIEHSQIYTPSYQQAKSREWW